jgi:MoaA/NifB/PqqE/SkfB family radical SAM enzyme
MSLLNNYDPVIDYKTLYDNNDISMWLDLSTHCNAACPQCHRTDANGLGKIGWLPTVQWSFEQFKQAFPVETMSHIDRFDICGTWGDPMMNKDIWKIIEYIIRYSSCWMVINTNGSIRDEDWWWKLGLLTGKRLTVVWAIDGINQQQHARYRQLTDLNKILMNMEAFNAAGGKSEVFTVVFKHNEKDIHNIATMVKSLGTNILFLVKSNRFYSNSTFHFVTSTGDEDVLERSTLPDSDGLYWKSIHLSEKNMEWIKNESLKGK